MAQVKAKINCGATEDKVIWNISTDSVVISITHNSESGIANNIVTEYLSSVLEIPKGKINIIKGLDKANKTIEIDNTINFIKDKIMAVNA
jgi:uncharacterized protein YggU (UPF0235/DUF167 family)